jgi:Domain of unknown function (DUF4389)
MSDHPIRLRVEDDLRRTRITVGLRVLLAIPHYIWLALWSFVAFFAALLNWLATLMLGRSPGWLHRFLAAYVKYVTQLFAYLRIAADPYPSFDAPDGYPIDLSIDPAARQNRLTVLFRLPLALPAILIAGALGGLGGGSFSGSSGSRLFSNGIAGLTAVAGWFVSVGRRQMPHGLRDMSAYSLGYGAQLWAYLLMLTDRYPDSDPLAALPEAPNRDLPVQVRCEDDLHRSRLTVLFRLPLSFPHLFWLTLWTVVAIPAAIANWLATLVRGRPPAALHRFLSAYVRYTISVYAFLELFANPFPGFVGSPGAYPALETLIAAPASQNRWKTLFRGVLAIPALLFASAFSSLAWILGVLGWFSALVRGRAPRGLRTSGALALRYQAQTLGYLLLLNDAYPYTGPLLGDGPEHPPPPSSPLEAEPEPGAGPADAPDPSHTANG